MKKEPEMISGAGSVDVNPSRTKRRKETTQVVMSAATSKSNNVASDPSAIEFNPFSLPDRQGCDKEKVWFPLLSPLQPSSYSFRGRRGCLFSTEFMCLPSERQYADYCQEIQDPVALDEIKSRIETENIPTST